MYNGQKDRKKRMEMCYCDMEKLWGELMFYCLGDFIENGRLLYTKERQTVRNGYLLIHNP